MALVLEGKVSNVIFSQSKDTHACITSSIVISFFMMESLNILFHIISNYALYETQGFKTSHQTAPLNINTNPEAHLSVPLQDLTDPMMVMFEQPEEEQEDAQEQNTFEVTEAIPDVELFGFKTSTRSIEVLSGA